MNFKSNRSIFIARTLRLDDLLARKSFFLFGPRATGKTSLIKQTFLQKPTQDLRTQYKKVAPSSLAASMPTALNYDSNPEILYLNLLHNDIYQKFLRQPELLRELVLLRPECQLVILDEIQRVPVCHQQCHYNCSIIYYMADYHKCI